VEGEHELADRNRKVGELEIQAANLRRNLPARSDIEVSVSISADRLIRISAYLPLLDEHFEGKIDMRRHSVNPADLQADYTAELARYDAALAKAPPGAETTQLAGEIAALPLQLEVKQLLAAAPADPDAAAKGEKRLLELKLKLDEATNRFAWPALTKQAREHLKELHGLAQRLGNGEQQERARELADAVAEFIQAGQADRLRKKLEQVQFLCLELYSTQPEFWVKRFLFLQSIRQKLTDQARAALLLQQGNDCIAGNKIVILQNIVNQLHSLLPPGENYQRGYESGLMR